LKGNWRRQVNENRSIAKWTMCSSRSSCGHTMVSRHEPSWVHGKSVNEVAEIVGLNEATVKTRMFYARRKLAELVAMA
jgi:hypothetical protein